jgi:hypothetical protein
MGLERTRKASGLWLLRHVLTIICHLSDEIDYALHLAGSVTETQCSILLVAAEQPLKSPLDWDATAS